MDFKIEQPKHHQPTFPKNDLDSARNYAKLAFKEFGKLLRAVILFGSSAHPDAHRKSKSDIDILVILDDLEIQLSSEMLEAYRIISQKLVGQVDKKLHITTLKFTTFWDLMRTGDPVAINMLREGLPLIDTGFFEPMQILLSQGKIKPTSESVHAYFARAPKAVQSARFHLLQGIVDMYWGVIDATQAAIMNLSIDPPGPKNAGKIVREELVGKYLDKKFANTVDVFYSLAKKILHRELKEVSGPDYHTYLKEAHEYVEAVRRFLERGDLSEKKRR